MLDPATWLPFVHLSSVGSWYPLGAGISAHFQAGDGCNGWHSGSISVTKVSWFARHPGWVVGSRWQEPLHLFPLQQVLVCSVPLQVSGPLTSL